MDCYVYVHRRTTDGSIFYVGKGRGKRAWKKTQRNDWWKRIEAKYGRTVEIVLSRMTDDQAFQLEKELIDWFGLENLCNLRDGGEGGFAMSEENKAKMSSRHKGRIVSAETREKMRIASTGQKHSAETKEKLRLARLKQVMPEMSQDVRAAISDRMKGRIVSEETRKKISESKKGKPGSPMSEENKEKLRLRNTGKRLTEAQKISIGNANRGKKRSPEVIAKIRISNARLNKERRKPVLCSNGMIFSFAGDAEAWVRENGRPMASRTNIVSCCTGKLKSAYGYTWSFAE